MNFKEFSRQCEQGKNHGHPDTQLRARPLYQLSPPPSRMVLTLGILTTKNARDLVGGWKTCAVWLNLAWCLGDTVNLMYTPLRKTMKPPFFKDSN